MSDTVQIKAVIPLGVEIAGVLEALVGAEQVTVCPGCGSEHVPARCEAGPDCYCCYENPDRW